MSHHDICASRMPDHLTDKGVRHNVKSALIIACATQRSDKKR